MPAQTFDFVDDEPVGSTTRWARRMAQDDPAPGTWLSTTVDIEPESDVVDAEVVDPIHQHAPKRVIKVHDGGIDKLVELMSSRNRARTRLLKRDLRWINSELERMGYEIALLREPTEDD